MIAEKLVAHFSGLEPFNVYHCECAAVLILEGSANAYLGMLAHLFTPIVLKIAQPLFLELTANGIFVRPRLTATPLTQKIANMDLPVSDWSQMEREIEEGRLE